MRKKTLIIYILLIIIWEIHQEIFSCGPVSSSICDNICGNPCRFPKRNARPQIVAESLAIAQTSVQRTNKITQHDKDS